MWKNTYRETFGTRRQTLHLLTADEMEYKLKIAEFTQNTSAKTSEPEIIRIHRYTPKGISICWEEWEWVPETTAPDQE